VNAAARLGAALAGLLLAGPAAAGPELDYMLHCQGCHLADGAGTPGKIPALADQVGLFLRVPGGRAFLVRVPGVATSALDDAATARLLNWMIPRFGPATEFAPYTADEVAPLRASPLVDVTETRDALLRALASAPD